jgi:hypothetical protein
MDEDTAVELRLLRGEVRVLGLEMRAGFAEIRTQVAELRGSVQAMFDSLVDFRREFQAHDHSNGA